MIARGKGNLDCGDLSSDPCRMTVATPLAMIAVALALGVGVRVRLGGPTIIKLMDGAIAMRMTRNGDVSRAVNAHKEHGNRDQNAPKEPHSGAMLLQISCQGKKPAYTLPSAAIRQSGDET